MSQHVLSAAGRPLQVETSLTSDRLRVSLRLHTPGSCLLHWGVARGPGAPWACPPEEWWPGDTQAAGLTAVRTPFRLIPGAHEEAGEVTLEFPAPPSPRSLVFVLHEPDRNRWIRDGGRDFVIPLPGVFTPAEMMHRWHPEADPLPTIPLDTGDSLAVTITPAQGGVRVALACDAEGPLVLHWGLASRSRHEWTCPPAAALPPGSELLPGQAARSPFTPRDGLQALEWTLPVGEDVRWLRCVVMQPATGAWLKSGGADLALPLRATPEDPRLTTPALRELASRIIEAEVTSSSWTLMHRFQLAQDLLPARDGDPAAVALIFAWLRYSAVRQLDWQRNYNTKPRDLAHAQDRLTRRAAALWKAQPAGTPGRYLARLLLTTLGRGGEGQRVRDDILHIMHRNHIKENGNFLEEWHQKLHNNTTPDDVVICQAYLAFLRSGGDVKVFDATLAEHGVTRERLRAYERPIRLDPEFFPEKQHDLIREFSDYLRTLKAVHDGADLETCAAAARPHLGNATRAALDAVTAAGQRPTPTALVALREQLVPSLTRATGDEVVRDLLGLDLALESAFRAAVEGLALDSLRPVDLADLTGAALRNAILTAGDEELAAAERHWIAFRTRGGTGVARAQRALSLVERLGRWVQAHSDDLQRTLQPLAAVLGEGFQAATWAVTGFTEAVVRGGPAFPLSRILRALGALGRRQAGVGVWQVISPAGASGRVVVVADLTGVQAERYATPTVLVAESVSGEEEIPEGVTGLLTRSQPDLVSHVAVRARNAGVLFASCLDDEEFARLRGLAGQSLALKVVGGDVEHRPAEPADVGDPAAASMPANQLTLRAAAARAANDPWVLTAGEFRPDLVGGKSNNLNALRGRLPRGVLTPRSIALPFGTCERVLAEPGNQERREKLARLANAGVDDLAGLAETRLAIQEMTAPDALREALQATWRTEGLPPTVWDRIWTGVRRVWASKWTERAHLSRRARGVPTDAVAMAVLIQEVVPADLAFVLHTVHPLTGDPGEVFLELVLGLGETLVGSYPGRALGCVVRKDTLEVRPVSYPSKSVALSGRGVIFRSDSNAEDLDGFAGAGLYESVLAEDPREVRLDYVLAEVVWDDARRDQVARDLARLGVAIEQLCGSPQDVEGAIHAGRIHVVQTRPQVGL